MVDRRFHPSVYLEKERQLCLPIRKSYFALASSIFP
jgi:hypothetical protein